MPRLTGLGLTVKSPSVAGGDQNITGPHIASTAAVYAPMLHRGAIKIAGVTHYEGQDISAASFDHETPAGDDRLLVVVAVYKDTAGIASLVFGSNGTGEGEFTSPSCVAIDSDGYIYVTDTGNNRVQKFTSAGVFVLEWGSAGAGNGELDSPQGIAVSSDGTIYVADTDNNRIQYFTSTGVYVGQWGGSGSGDGEFNVPSGIAVDSSGYVYVVELDNNRVQKFTDTGGFVTKWGSVGPGDGEFDTPISIAIAPSGNVFVGGGADSRVQEFTAAGVFVATYNGQDGFEQAPGLAFDSGGNLYTNNSAYCRVYRYDPNIEFVTQWGGMGVGNGQFNNPFGMATDSAGALYVVDQPNHRVQKFAANLKLNTARYGGEEMAVGPLVDSGSYFVAFYSLETPAVGTAEVAFAAPTEPDIIMLTAISINGADTANTDYSGPNAGMAEQEAHATQLQVSHNRTYPTNTLSLFALLYESAGVTLTPASGNFVWIERNVGDLRLALGWRPIPSDTTGSITFGATAGASVAPYISSVLHIEGKRGHIDAPFIASSSQVYAPVVTHEGQTIYPGTIAAAAQVYAPSFHHVITAPHIAAGGAVYAPAFATEPGATQYIELCFIGGGTPQAFNGPHIASTAAVYAPSITSEVFIEPEFVESGEQVFAPTFDICLHVGTGAVYAPTFANA